MSTEPINIETFGLTDQGRVRGVNQDQFLIADLTKALEVRQTSLRRGPAESLSEVHGQVLLVADGMGGHAAGGEASAIAVETLRTYLVHTMRWALGLRSNPDSEGDGGGDSPESDPVADADLKLALERCHDAVLAAGRDRPEREGMGTTMTLAYVMWPRLYLVHVGDSRCYLLRDGQLQRVTRDHTYAQRLVDEGGLSPAQAEDSFLSNVLTRVIGGDAKGLLEVDVHQLELEISDTLMLATDGLGKHVSEGDIHGVLSHSASAEEVCRRLVTAALDGGGSDNVTVVAARFAGES